MGANEDATELPSASNTPEDGNHASDSSYTV